jgi:sporulation protein YlmC with PRC-barrel domain
MVFQPDASQAETNGRASDLIGRRVVNNSNQQLGTVKDFVLSLSGGQVCFVVVSTGSRNVAVPASALTPRRHDFALHADDRRLISAPDFAKLDLQDPAWPQEVASYFGGLPPAVPPKAEAANGSAINEPAGAEAQPPQVLTRSSDLIGMTVRDAQGNPVGDIKDVVVDWKSGRVVYAVLDPEGMRGLGTRYFAIPPQDLVPTSTGGSLALKIGKERLSTAPSFAPAHWPSPSNQAFAAQVYQFYNHPMYWQSQ